MTHKNDVDNWTILWWWEWYELRNRLHICLRANVVDAFVVREGSPYRGRTKPRSGEYKKGTKSQKFQNFSKKIIFFVLSIGTRRMNYSEVRTRVGRTPRDRGRPDWEEMEVPVYSIPMYRKSDGRYLDEFWDDVRFHRGEFFSIF